ncbi:porphobilinogen deaminase 1 [Streptomyces lucensis JCM 4490]|uniref:Porphobilinogen deaminase n=1 Tax=Streptomyces lucensis JCM 4490 TaxID=1306176 RepID=A0A918JFD8_9ACTN|nr:hydroxymethylbilane synthase [Streptomyces lucensis]GGW77672.1 porphobilinogen deaminase 1 [Streptomyces lucensis JCM 4490]
MTEKALRLGTRRSKLAMAQSGQVAQAVTRVTGRPVELVEITTHGDVSRAHLTQIGGTGVFVTALRDALLAGEVDFAVHSLKDLPTTQPEDLVLAAIPEREDPRDVIVARDALKFTDLAASAPNGVARIGTGAPRRMAQLNAYARAHGLDLETVPIRGNVDTRIRYVRDGELDAVVLAAAGLNRLGRIDEVTDFLSVDTVLPAPGQGALAIECTADDADLIAALGALDDPFTRAAVTAERSLLAALEAGCSAPVGALADLPPLSAPLERGDPHADEQIVKEMRLRGVVGTTDGTRTVQLSTTGPVPQTHDQAMALGRELATEMLDQGAAGLMGERAH